MIEAISARARCFAARALLIVWAVWLAPLAARGQDVPRRGDSGLLTSHPTVRRVCVLDGVPTFSAADRRARIVKKSPTRPSRLGGGTYVQVAGVEVNGYQPVRTADGLALWIPSSESGRPSLCLAQPAVMRVCPHEAGAADAPVYDHFDSANPVVLSSLARGTRVQIWEYFEDHGRWTFVERDGTVGFVKSEDLCLEDTAEPADSDATTRFAMTIASASPDCYSSYRVRAASEIRRVVIHNTEQPLKSAIAMFRSCDPGHPTSAHVVIDRDGRMHRLVEDRFAAYHTGGNHGGFNSVSLGIEVVASDTLRSMTPPQEQSLVALIRFWMTRYHVELPERVAINSTRARGYQELEFWQAPVTIHRQISAGRGTDCPTFIWADSAQGDEEFFRWRARLLKDGS